MPSTSASATEMFATISADSLAAERANAPDLGHAAERGEIIDFRADTTPMCCDRGFFADHTLATHFPRHRRSVKATTSSWQRAMNTVRAVEGLAACLPPTLRGGRLGDVCRSRRHLYQTALSGTTARRRSERRDGGQSGHKLSDRRVREVGMGCAWPIPARLIEPSRETMMTDLVPPQSSAKPAQERRSRSQEAIWRTGPHPYSPRPPGNGCHPDFCGGDRPLDRIGDRVAPSPTRRRRRNDPARAALARVRRVAGDPVARHGVRRWRSFGQFLCRCRQATDMAHLADPRQSTAARSADQCAMAGCEVVSAATATDRAVTSIDPVALRRSRCHPAPRRVAGSGPERHSSSRSRRTASLAGFFVLSHTLRRPAAVGRIGPL